MLSALRRCAAVHTEVLQVYDNCEQFRPLCSNARECLQVVRNACGMAVIDDYHDLGKYNIKTLCADEEAAAAAPAK